MTQPESSSARNAAALPGRATVSNRLLAAVDSWRNGKGDVVFLAGEPGMGKSALLSWVEGLRDSNTIILRVDCRPPIGTFNVSAIAPLQPFGLAIEQLYLQTEEKARKRLVLNVGMSVLSAIPVIGDFIYAFKAVSQDLNEYKKETAALQQKKKAAVQDCVDTLREIGRQTPFILLVDDGHWSDSQSVEVVRQLLGIGEDIPVLIVWAYTPSIAQRVNVPLATLLRTASSVERTMSIEPLPAEETLALVRLLVPNASVSAATLKRLHERSDGIPGILTEYVKYLEHAGFVQSDGTIADDGVDDLAVKGSTHPATDVVLRDISEDDAVVLSLCAAEGREFTAFMVSELLNVDVITAIRTLRRLQVATGLFQSVGMRTRYGVKTTTYEFTQSFAFTYFLHRPEYEERKAVHQRIAEILSREYANASLTEVRHQLAVFIAAHSVEAEDSATAERMLAETADAADAMGAPEVARWIREKYGTSAPDDTSNETSAEGVDDKIADGVQSVSLTPGDVLVEAAESLLSGNANGALRLSIVCLQAPGVLSIHERVMLTCMAARANIEMNRREDAEVLLRQLDVLSLSSADRCTILNVRAVSSMHNRNPLEARAHLREAATLSTSLPVASRILTLGNIVTTLRAAQDPDTHRYERTLRKLVDASGWSRVRADLQLSLALLFTLATALGSGAVCSAAVAQDSVRTNVHERHMERAHPTPSKTANVPLLPFVLLSPFPSSFLNVNMIAPETDQSPMQNESSIAINPTDPLNLIGAAVDYRASSATWVYHTTNGGKAWSNTNLGYVRPGWASSNDPSVAFDKDGRGYLCYGGFGRDTTKRGENGVFVSITTDGGRSWGPTHIPVIVHIGKQTADSSFEDKYYVHVDTAGASPYKGHVYIPWKRVINRDSSTQIVISKSTDRGLTWSRPKNVSERFSRTSEDTTFGQSFPLARTGPDGSVHLVWNSGTESSVRYARSTDGGATWTPPRIIHTYASFGTKSRIGTQVNSRVKGSVRAEAYPTLSIDNTNGPRRGWLYLCWAAGKVPDIFFSRSTDNGATWSPKILVHSVSTNDQFWPWISVDPTSGDVAVMYFDSRDDDANILVNTYVSLTTDGGTTWTDRRVGDGVNDLRNNPFDGRTFAGDYSGCDFYNGKVYPSWVDMRNTTQTNMADNDVYTSIVDTRAPSAPTSFEASVIAEQPTRIQLDWSAVTVSTFGKALDMATSRYVLSREGTVIATLPLTTLSYTDMGLTAHNLYHYALAVTTATDTSITRLDSAFAGGSKAPGRTTLVDVEGNTAPEYKAILTVRLPALRADGITPLVNLASIRLHASEKVYDLDVSQTDTGRTLSFTINVYSAGWFHFSAQTIDADGNVGESSDTLVEFMPGIMGRDFNGPERFDSVPRFWVKRGTWGLSTNGFGHASPTSYTDSPAGPYLAVARDTVILNYIEVPVPLLEGYVGHLTWFVAAFVDPLDTVFLDISRNGPEGPWTTHAWWNSSLETRWGDTTKGDDAWRYGFIETGGVILPRLRFKSNVSRQSDGFYIDDIGIGAAVSSVDDRTPSPLATAPYPNPSTSHAVFGLLRESDIDRVTVTDITGADVSGRWQQHGRTVVLDVRTLTAGVYTVTLTSGMHTSTSLVRVMR